MTKESTEKEHRKKPSGPHWATVPFRNFIDDTHRLQHVVQLSARGISMLCARPKILEALVAYKEDFPDLGDVKNQLEDAQQEAELAKHEVATDFPILHAWAVVALWAHLEALVRNFLSVWLKNQPLARQCDPIQRLRIRLGDYEAIANSYKSLYIIELLEKELGVGLRNGVQHFEALLEPFGLSGPVPKPIADVLYELGQVRNLIAHNAGKVDRRFNEACPWLKAKIGSSLNVSSQRAVVYFRATILYATLILTRSGKIHGKNMTEASEAVEKGAEELSNLALKSENKKHRSP